MVYLVLSKGPFILTKLKFSNSGQDVSAIHYFVDVPPQVAGTIMEHEGAKFKSSPDHTEDPTGNDFLKLLNEAHQIINRNPHK